MKEINNIGSSKVHSKIEEMIERIKSRLSEIEEEACKARKDFDDIIAPLAKEKVNLKYILYNMQNGNEPEKMKE